MDKNNILETCKKYGDDLIKFTQELVKIRSYSDEEGEIAQAVLNKMKELGYDEAFIDSTGNVVGKIGTGEKIIMFDSHLDTVQVPNPQDWTVDPFEAKIIDNQLYGRGSVDMKSGLAASVYAAAIAKECNLLQGKTIYITGSVCEEFCDGVNIKMFFEEYNLKPDYVVICEPSDNIITLGHKGKAQILITTHGVSAHGSAPEKGINAVYEMAEIIQRVEAKNKELFEKGNPHGTMVLSDINCVSASLNAVPSECSVYIDRRMVLGETEEDVKKEMDAIIEGKRATWQIGTLRHTSWKGAKLVYEPIHAPWKIDRNHELTLACDKSYEETFGAKPEKYDFWDFGTNAVTPVSMGVPTIGFGPGEYKLAHMVDENCDI
ncbi:MAG: YgeY family selenium metabolism-linked hydrolase, partial [Intestinibacter sp.]|uniref:YgeY family selenium metabolism-linked hydrolase n=1 Tax=Intestinibacter sp. TaxID=1965304 RepID=UPI003F18F1EF